MTWQERYEKLYRLQDTVLNIVFADEVELYLTGGTCLHRFHFEARYSDDLDLFTADSTTYRDEVRVILDRLRSQLNTLKTIVDTRDFVRVLVDDALQVDFVNDRVQRIGAAQVTEAGVRIDNLENIAANKICAILGRDEPKDVFDLCAILQSRKVGVASMLAGAEAKCTFDLEQLEMRLRSFPVEFLDNLAVKDRAFAENLQAHYHSLIEHLIQA
jgi:predicted nucleotidyltransferase component of viral defense system